MEDSAAKRGRRAQELLKDAERVYDPKQERQWEKKYQFFSEIKMKAAYRTFARARHDPFNKDPAWGKSVLSEFAKYCASNGVKFQDIFHHIDLNGDQALSRPEIKHALRRVLPSLSDQEVITIFDVIDEDHSGAVSVQEFLSALESGRSAKFTKEAIERHRNPTHRMKRFPPACLDGWEHLKDVHTVQGTRYEKVGTGRSFVDMCDQETSQCLEQLSQTLIQTPRALRSQLHTPRHHYFGGGADTARFYKHGKMEITGMALPQVDVPDPGGPELRPGYLCDLKQASRWLRPHTRG